MTVPAVLYDRRVRITVAKPVATPGDFSHVTTSVIEINGGKTDDPSKVGLRIAFKIDKSLEKEPNTSELTITNLSQAQRDGLQVKGVKVRVEAGYKQTGMSQLFAGDARTIDHVRDGSDWNTIAKLGDGERAWRWARVSESFGAGTLGSDIMKRVGRSLGVDLGNLDDAAALVTARFDHGFVATGSAARVFDQIVRSVGMEWSIQDGKLQVLQPEQVRGLPIPFISPQTGLVGSPEMGTPTTKGKPALLQFKCLLIPVVPGGKVKLQSARYNGFVRVRKVTFQGDTSGGDWYSIISGTISS